MWGVDGLGLDRRLKSTSGHQQSENRSTACRTVLIKEA
jgi:hypothetical protein